MWQECLRSRRTARLRTESLSVCHVLAIKEIAAYLITFEKHEEWLTTSPKTSHTVAPGASSPSAGRAWWRLTRPCGEDVTAERSGEESALVAVGRWRGWHGGPGLTAGRRERWSVPLGPRRPRSLTQPAGYPSVTRPAADRHPAWRRHAASCSLSSYMRCGLGLQTGWGIREREERSSQVPSPASTALHSPDSSRLI
ncbi:hypothetical protein AAFF_G00207100 [Aldrovandia affinis]|uniref:Uncharacterized protein n=1 Tax=Aldrovandia affinis TaxID=143900 RepID=A0AAD7RHF3_9TELE|nr:hypothetical protein AAFF_G00207100 [Aldrovandia affinis]